MSSRDPINHLEGKLERDRQQLTKSLEDLKTSLTFNGLKDQGRALIGVGKAQASEKVSEVTDAASQAAQSVGTSLSSAAQVLKDNPVASAASAAAVGWVVNKFTNPARQDPQPASDMRLSDLFQPSGAAPSDDEFWMADVDRLRARAADYEEMLEDAVRRGSTPLDVIAERRAELRASLQQDTRRAMMRGLEGLSASARDKAFTRREEMYARHLGHSTSSGWVKPVALSVAVAGAGLAAAWLLPKTTAENKLLGDARLAAAGQLKKLWDANPKLAATVATKLATAAVKSAIRKL